MFSQKRVFLMFREMELSSPTIKNPLIFLQIKKLFFRKWNFLKNFLYFPKRGNFPDSENKKSTLKKFILFWEMELSSLKLKKLIYFLKKKNLLYFRRELSQPENQKFVFKVFFFQENPEGFFTTVFFFFLRGRVSFWVFSFFTTVFWVFSLLIAFFQVTNFLYLDCFFAAFLSGTSLLCNFTASATDLRVLFLPSRVFYLTLLLHICHNGI